MISPEDEDSFNQILEKSILGDSFYEDPAQAKKEEEEREAQKNDKFAIVFAKKKELKPKKPNNLTYGGLQDYAMSNPRSQFINIALELETELKKQWPNTIQIPKTDRDRIALEKKDQLEKQKAIN